mgnify:CR=1 FL=1
MHRIISLIFSGVIFALSVSAQKVDIQPTISPDFFTPDEEITITYDVTGTSLSGLDEAWIWLWLPDQDQVDVPSNVNPADTDPEATDPAKFNRFTENGRVYFEITLILTQFTDKSASEIKEVGVLIKGNDWSDGQSTDFLFEVPEGFDYKVNSPQNNYAFYDPDEIIEIDIIVSQSSSVSLSIDDQEVFSHPDTTAVFYEHEAIDDGNVHIIEFTAVNPSNETLSYSHSYTTQPIVNESTVPDGKIDGVNYDSETSVTLVLTAPNKDNVYVIGDFNNWSLDQDFLMNLDGDKYWLEITGLEPGKEYIYQYLIDGSLVVADPYAEKISSSFDDPEIISENRYPGLKPFPTDKTGFEASYLQTAQPEYNWTVTDFTKPDPEDLVIYELLVRDFTDQRTYKAVTEKLDYLDSLGINAIELMPVTEFEGNLSWGYNPSFKLAPDKYYGTENELKELIDEAHKRGMAIIFDMVLNHHFGRSSLVRMYSSGDFGPPTAENYWFNVTAKHDFNVGYDFNHESQYTMDYVDRVVTYWTDKYKVDGYRFDLSKGFTQKNTLGNTGAWGQYDASRISLLKRMADVIWQQDPETYIILEHFADNSEEQELANYGMMLWGNMNHDYRKAAKAQSASLTWAYHGARGWNDPNLISYMESHDEERVMWDVNKQTDKNLEERLNRIKLNAAFFFLVPGPKMIWQFGEFGYDEELNNDRLGIKPTRWEYLDDPERVRLFATFQSLIGLKTKTEYLRDENFSWDATGMIKWINYDNDDVKISVYGNFSSVSRTGDPNIISTGTWYDYLTGKEIEITDTDEVSLGPGEFYILTSEPIDNFTNINPVDFITGMDENSSPISVSVYPNPSSEKISVRSEGTFTRVRIRDLSGKIVQTKNETSPTNHSILDISDLNHGMYLIEIKSVKGLFKLKIIKQ